MRPILGFVVRILPSRVWVAVGAGAGARYEADTRAGVDTSDGIGDRSIISTRDCR